MSSPSPDPVGRSVLVKSSLDRHHPPIARRGTVVRREATASGPRLFIELEFPQMFTQTVHRRTVVLDPPAVARLLASEHNGTYEITIPEELDEPGAG